MISSSRCCRIPHSSAAFQGHCQIYTQSPICFNLLQTHSTGVPPATTLPPSHVWMAAGPEGRGWLVRALVFRPSSQCPGMCREHVLLLSGKSGIASTRSFFRQGWPVLSSACHSCNCWEWSQSTSLIFPVEIIAEALEGSLTGLDPDEEYILCGFERSFSEGNITHCLSSPLTPWFLHWIEEYRVLN